MNLRKYLRTLTKMNMNTCIPDVRRARNYLFIFYSPLLVEQNENR